VVGKVPSPWGEAAKGILHLKRIEFAAVRLVYDSEALKSWARELSGPVAIYDDEPPRSGWREILELAERLAPAPALLPAKPELRERALQLAGKLCDPGGLGWHRRLQLVQAGISGAGGFGERIAAYLGQKYGYDAAQAAHSQACVLELLGEFAGLLRARRDAGSEYYFDTLSALDVYSAAFMGLFKPLPEAQCEMNPSVRTALEWLDAPTAAALDPVLLEHRDMMYARHLALPLCL
jgi:hypothetical protein